MDGRNANDVIVPVMSYLYSLSPIMRTHEEREEEVHLVVDTVDTAAAAAVPVVVNRKCRMPLLLMILLLYLLLHLYLLHVNLNWMMRIELT